MERIKQSIPNINNKIKPFSGMKIISVSSSISIILNLYKSGTLFNAKIVCICTEHKFNAPKLANKCKHDVVTSNPIHGFLT